MRFLSSGLTFASVVHKKSFGEVYKGKKEKKKERPTACLFHMQLGTLDPKVTLFTINPHPLQLQPLWNAGCVVVGWLGSAGTASHWSDKLLWFARHTRSWRRPLKTVIDVCVGNFYTFVISLWWNEYCAILQILEWYKVNTFWVLNYKGSLLREDQPVVI